MSSIYDWSLMASENDDADDLINWVENQLPDTVNNSDRAMMQRIAEWREDMTGGLVTAGTQPAYTLATRAAFATVGDGRFLTARIHATNAGGAATLNVNGIGAKAIRKFGTSGDMPLGVGDLQLGGLYQFMYSSTANAGAGGWVISNPSIATGGGFASGTAMLFMTAAAPVGWTKSTAHDNKALRIVAGVGGASGGTDTFTATLNNTISSSAVALTAAQMPSHAHTQQGSFTSGTVSSDHTHAQSGGFASGTESADHSHAYTYTAAFVTTEGGVGAYNMWQSTQSIGTGGRSAGHYHSTAISGQTGGISANHTHAVTISGATAAAGSGGTHAHTTTLAIQYVDSIICTKD